MAWLINGSDFLVRTSNEGFDDYVVKRALVQNKDADHNESHTKNVSWIDGTDDHNWITAPAQSTRKWVLKAYGGNDYVQGTDNNSNWLYGYDGDDYLHGSSLFKDYLNGGDGDDSIFGYGGNDKLTGKNGDDQLVGGPGSDRLFGGAGDDNLKGGDGNDLLLAGYGSNIYFGGAGADRFGLMKRHEQNIIGDFNPIEGDELLIRRRHFNSVDVSFSGRGTNDEAQFWLESSQGLTGIQAQSDTTTEDIMGAIKVV